jgi:hypothetical protein
MHETEVKQRLEDEQLLFGSSDLRQEYKSTRYTKEHRTYIKRKIQESLQDGSVKIEDREAMFANYDHLCTYIENLPKEENIVEAIEKYLKNAEIEDDNNELEENLVATSDKKKNFRYPFAHKMLTKIKLPNKEGLHYPPNGLGAHIQEVDDYGESVAFTSDGKYKLGSFFSEGKTETGDTIPPEHYAALLVDVVGPVHDILKFLGTLEAQIMPDHEIMTAALVRKYFEGRTVTLRGKDYTLTEEDVEFVAQVIEDHENIGDPNYLRELGRDKYASADNNADRAKSLFFLIDTQTGVFEVGEDGKVVLNQEQLKKRFADLYFRHVARFIYENDTEQVIKTAKVFRPEWGAYALRDYIALFTELENSSDIEMPADWRELLINTALEVLEESEKEHYELLEHGVAYDPETGENYSFSVQDILQIRDTKIQLVKQLFNTDKIVFLDQVFDRFFDQRSELGAQVVYYAEQTFMDVLAEADIFSGDENQKEKQEQLVAKILADPFTYKLDHLMHQRAFLYEAAKVASDGYNERHDYPANELVSDQERSFNLSSFVSLQETLGILADKTTKSQEEVLKSILEGTLSFKEWLTLVEAQKMSYLASRLWNGDAFFRDIKLFDQSSVDDRKEDWYQILDNSKLMAKWLSVDYVAADPDKMAAYAEDKTFLQEKHPEFLEQVVPLLHPEYAMNFDDGQVTNPQRNTIRRLSEEITDKKAVKDMSEIDREVMESIAGNGTELMATILGVIQLANELEESPIKILEDLAKVKHLDDLAFSQEDLKARDIYLYKHLMTYKDKIWQEKEMEMGLNPSGFSTKNSPNEDIQRLGLMAERILDFINPGLAFEQTEV